MKIRWNKERFTGSGIVYRLWFEDTGRFMVWDDVNDGDNPYGAQIDVELVQRNAVRKVLLRYQEQRLNAGLDLMAIQVVAGTEQTVIGRYHVEW